MKILILTLLFTGTVFCQSSKDLNVLDRIFSINQVNANTDTFSNKIKAELFEGDILWTKRLKATIGALEANAKDGISTFDAIRNGVWKGGIVPYTFARGFRYGAVVNQAIQEYNAKTCIKFQRYTASNARAAGGYIEFMHGGGCYSMIGRQGGKQQISLGNGCGVKGVTVHEMMHALGFFHEQSRRDRDSYITINWNNINRAMWYNFKKYQPGQASTLGESYDKTSVMHYGSYAFSINGRKTIVSKANQNERLGQRVGLSRIDVRQLNKYYKCGNTGVVTPTKTTVVVSNCKNNYEFCTSLTGWCKNTFVRTNCKKSCQLCSQSKCVDTNNNCRYWATVNRFCQSSKYKSYMQDKCKKSCNFC